jgi:glutaminyl-peptide cyclotransferase
MIGEVRSAISAALLCIVVVVSAAPGRAADTATDDTWYVQVSLERVVGQTAIPVNGFKIVQTYPHDTRSYTEGLVMRDGFMFEGTGRYGLSRLRQYELQTGRVIHDLPLDRRYFGEGAPS